MLSERVRPYSEAAPWVIEEILKLESMIEHFRLGDVQMEKEWNGLQDLVEIQHKELSHMRDEIFLLKPFRNLVYHIASKRQNEIDDYIRLAKQAIADYESVLST